MPVEKVWVEGEESEEAVVPALQAPDQIVVKDPKIKRQNDCNLCSRFASFFIFVLGKL